MSRFDYYIGIDESNHGNKPEIYVAAQSISEEDVLRKRRISKRRLSLADLVEEIDDFRFIVLYEEDLTKYGNANKIKMPVFKVLLSSFGRTDLSNTQIIIDGEEIKGASYLGSDLKNKGIILPQENVEFITKADVKYSIVTSADWIAYALMKKYSGMKRRGVGPFAEKRVYLDLQKYTSNA